MTDVALRPLLDRLGGLGRIVLDAVLPPRCLACGVEVAAPGQLCVACWRGVGFLGPPQCAACGLPFEHDMGAGALCAVCLRRRPPYGRARAVFRYDDASRGMVLAFKHGDRTDAAPAFGRWLARAGAELLEDADLVVPVPLHRWRLLRRRYNQSALLALAVSRSSGVAAVPDLIRRVRATASQGGLSAGQRRRNVAGAFRVAPRLADRVAGRRVVLVDDVHTTGATLVACTGALRRAGATNVDVLTLARVVRPSA